MCLPSTYPCIPLQVKFAQIVIIPNAEKPFHKDHRKLSTSFLRDKYTYSGLLKNLKIALYHFF